MICHRAFYDFVEDNSFFMSGQQTGDLVENSQNLGAILCFDFHDVIAVKLQNIPLFNIRFSKVFLTFKKSNNAHGHTAHQQVLLEQKHGLIVHTSLQRDSLLETISDIWDQRRFVKCPAEFLKIQRVHLEMPFF